MNPLNSDIKTVRNILAKSLRLNDPRLFESIYQLRNWMGERRTERPRGYMSHGQGFHAYLAYYFPLHLGEVYWIFEQQRETFRQENQFEEIWDLGSGPGTASVSLLLWLKKEGLPLPKSFHLLDSSKKALDLAESLIRGLAPKVTVFKHRVNLLAPEGLKLIKRASKTPRFYILSHFLNELGSGPRKRVEKYRLIELLYGRVLIVEPPLREPTMDLMSLRDQLLSEDEETQSRILAPCPVSTGRCPMLARAMGWCYAQPPRSWLSSVGLTLWEDELRRWSGTKLQDLGFSYLLFDRGYEFQELEKDQYEIQISDTRNVKSLYCDGTKVTPRTLKGTHRGSYSSSES
jgi:ribosomal protein RSM22 (predicted rRNA methylase)